MASDTSTDQWQGVDSYSNFNQYAFKRKRVSLKLILKLLEKLIRKIGKNINS